MKHYVICAVIAVLIFSGFNILYGQEIDYRMEYLKLQVQLAQMKKQAAIQMAIINGGFIDHDVAIKEAERELRAALEAKKKAEALKNEQPKPAK